MTQIVVASSIHEPMRPLLLVTCLCLFPAVASAQVLPFVPPAKTLEQRAILQREAVQQISSLLSSTPLAEGDSARVVRLAATMRAVPALDERARLFVVGSGAIGTLASKQTTFDPAANGAVGFRLVSDVSQWTTLVGVVSTEPEVSDNAGALTFQPTLGPRSLTIDWQRWLLRSEFDTNAPGRSVGVQVSGSISAAKWRDSTNVVPAASVATALVVPRLTFNLFAARAEADNLDYALRFDLGVPLRVAGAMSERSKAIRQRLLGTSHGLFPGIDAGATLLFGKMVVTARLSAVGGRGTDVAGLSGLQFSTGIAVQPDLLSLNGIVFR